MRTEGPAFLEEFMNDLRTRHLGAKPIPHRGPGPLERLDAAYAAGHET